MNNKNKIISQVIKIVILFLFLIIIGVLFQINISNASSKSQKQIGEYIAEFSVNFAKSHSSETAYCWDSYNRGQAYKGNKTSGLMSKYGDHFENKYGMDCVGWVSFAIHHSTGLDSSVASSGSGGFVTPAKYSPECSGSNGYFSIVSGTPQPGDILISQTHVMVYVGNGKVVDSITSWNGKHLTSGAVDYRTPYTNYIKIARITKKGVEAINDNDLTTVFNGKGAITGSCYDGLSDNPGLQEGTFSSVSYDLDWILNKLSDLLDWFIGIVTYLIRAIFVGWTSIIEGLVNAVVEWTTGTEASLTIEKLVNNKVAILDVNFFDFQKAGGETLEQDSIIYTIRENIAVWYYIIRGISIVGLLITLLYLGIRMALSTVGEQKAKYKELLINWLVSFIIVFFIHYIMIIILNINNSLIEFINATLGGGEESLYDSVRNGAYAIQASVGWSSTLMYMMLVYLLVKFVFMYFKRFLVVGILTFMAPILGVTYSIDKIKDNKSQSLSNWLKEYTFNVLIQSVHCLLYTLMVSLAFNMSGKSFLGTFLALFLIGFVLQAEGIFKKIFGIKSGNLKDALKSSIAILTAGSIAKRFVNANVKTTKFVTKPVTAPVKKLYDKTKVYKRMDKINGVSQAIDDARRTGSNSVMVGKNSFEIGSLLEDKDNFDSDMIANELVKKEEELKASRKKERRKMVQQAVNTVMGAAKTTAAIPMVFADPEEGLAMAVNAKNQLNKGINGSNKDKKYYTGKRDRIKNFATAGLYKNVKNMTGQTLQAKRKLNNSMNNTQHEIAIKALDKKINEEYDRLFKDVKIDEKELEKVVKSAKKTVPDEIIANSVYKMQAFLENNVTIKVNENGKKQKQQTSLYAQVEKLAGATVDINSLHQQAIEIIKADKNSIKFDESRFEQDVQSELIKMISKENGVRQKDVSKVAIAKKFKSMSTEEKKELMKSALNKSTELVEKTKETMKDKKTNIKLENVNEIIDSMKKTTKLPIDKEIYKKNFEDLIRGEISQASGIESDKIQKSDLDNYISDLTNEELTQKVKEAGVMQDSLKMDKNAGKPDYKKLIGMIQESKYHKIKMKGTD